MQAIWTVLKGFFRQGLAMKIISILVVLLGIAWFVAPKSVKDRVIHGNQSVTGGRLDSLSRAFNIMESLLVAEKRESGRLLGEVLRRQDISAAQRRKIDSLERLNNELRSIIIGGGRVDVTGSGVTIMNTYTDAWLTATVIPDTTAKAYLLEYTFSFDIKEVTSRFVNEGGMPFEVFSVQLVSTKDPGFVMDLDNYWRKMTGRLDEPRQLALRNWYWSDYAVNADFIFAPGNFEGGVSLSPFTWSRGGLEANDILIRWPDLGFSSDFIGTFRLTAGIRVNIAAWIPLLRDLYIAPKYSHNGEVGAFLLGIGTTL